MPRWWRGATRWEGETRELCPGVTLLRCGGHFAGGTALHWADGAGGKGALLTGDIAAVTPDGRLSFMRSYPNLIPLDAGSVRHIADVLQARQFDPIYGVWDRIIASGGKAALSHSMKRYLAAVGGPPVD
jgi:glyoxylase-like metal-dependent hydrolase (beta-lactamase superfamily II)